MHCTAAHKPKPLLLSVWSGVLWGLVPVECSCRCGQLPQLYSKCNQLGITNIHVAVLDRTRILFHRLFRAYHCVWRAIALSFCKGRGSYTLHRRIRYLCIYIAHMSPALSRSSSLQHVKLGDAQNTWRKCEVGLHGNFITLITSHG